MEQSNGINFQKLGQALAQAGLTDKPISQYTKEEIQYLVQTCIDALEPHKVSEFAKPYIKDDGTLVIPLDSDPIYHWWKPCGQSIYATLRELGASETIFNRYLAQPKLHEIEDEVPF